MNVHQKMVKDFMRAFDQDAPDRYSPAIFPAELRSSLIREEAEEFAKACSEKNFTEIIDAICDLLYVTYGAANALGIDIDPYFNEVHRSNMSKLGIDGKPIRREDGKILKPSTWSPPDFTSIMQQDSGITYLQPLPDAAS